jgi:hypothetical protein
MQRGPGQPWDRQPGPSPSRPTTPPAPHRALRFLRRIEGAPGDWGAATVAAVEDRKPTADTDQERRDRLNQRVRQAFIEGAEVDSRRLLGRGLTAEEMERVLRRYPGDMAYRRRKQPVESVRYFAREIEGGGAVGALEENVQNP